MSELISGKEALDAWWNDQELEVKYSNRAWDDFNEHKYGMSVFKSANHLFRLKQRTITLNGIEVPAPFEPEKYESCYLLHDLYECGYIKTSWKFDYYVRPAWRTEEEIKQVVAALRSIFK